MRGARLCGARGLRPGQPDHAPVPADAGRRVGTAERLVAGVAKLLVVHEGQRHGPVVRQVHVGPGRVVEIRSRGREERARFRERVAPAVAEVLGRVGGVAQREAPAEVEEDAPTRRGGNRAPAPKPVLGAGCMPRHGADETRRQGARGGGAQGLLEQLAAGHRTVTLSGSSDPGRPRRSRTPRRQVPPVSCAARPSPLSFVVTGDPGQ